MINSVGLQNIGVRAFVKRAASPRASISYRLANVFGYATDDYAEVVRVLKTRRASPAMSSRFLPQHEHGGMAFRRIPLCCRTSDPALKRPR